MKRIQARKVNEATNDLNSKLTSTNKPKFNVEITLGNLSRLTSNTRWYEQEDIANVAAYLIPQHGYDLVTQFEVVGGVEQLRLFLSRTVNQDSSFLIYNKGGNHWVTLCLTIFNGTLFVFYKDSLGVAISDELENAIEDCFPGARFRSHSGVEQIDGHSCGPMSLRNLEIILEGLNTCTADLIVTFEKTKFCSQSEVEKIKQKFADNLQKNLSKQLVQLLTDLVNDKEFEDFKVSLNKFLDTCSGYAAASDSMQEYFKVLQVETEKVENDANYVINQRAVDEAGKNFFGHEQVKKIIENQSNLTDVTVPDVQEKYPEHLAKFTEIFKLFAQSESDEKLETALQNVSKVLEIDYNKIKKFFNCKIKQVPVETAEENAMKPINIEEIKAYVNGIFSKRIQNPDLDTSNKTLEQLLSELVFNVADRGLESQEQYANLMKNFLRVKNRYETWKNKRETDIFAWAMAKKGGLLEDELCEAIAVMDRANDLVTGGNKLRDAQIISVLIFLQSKENKGKLCQISTGEGKTTIVSLLATLKVLQGIKVDVITSNQVLAEDGKTNREKFYGLLNISVSTNNADNSYKQGSKTCYTADVVYGTMGNFQFDHLRDSFEGLETRGERKFECVILDEVDSMLVDNGGYIAKLAGPFPGIDFLKYVYIKIWQELHKSEKQLYKDFEKSLKEKADELRKAEKCANFSPEELQHSYEKHIAELSKLLVSDIKEKIIDSCPSDIELIPAHLKEYADDMVEKWIDNAIYAKYQCQENEQYVIKKINGEDVIVPVDYQNTGVTLKNTIWSNGLHQFVQLKHNLHLTPESLTSSFISNIGYIKLYNNNIHGLTGTLGSVAEQKLLSSVYDVDYAKIPTFKPKNFEEIEGIVVKKDQWTNCVALASFLLSYQGRSVLIICKTIKDLKDLEKNIKALKKLEGFKELKIKTYQDEDGSHVVDDIIGASEIILATNIAGRGTDFRTSLELEQNGGLHVCISFLPVNQRVEDQAFGRTSRQGKAGTAQLIIKDEDVFELGLEVSPELNFEVIKEKRDEIEKARLEEVKNEELSEILFQDCIFSKFSVFYRNFKQKHSDKTFLVKDLKEFWAFWLQKKNFKNMDLSEVDKEFEEFKEEAYEILEGTISHNPYYSILLAEQCLSNNKIEQAKAALNHAIVLSGHHAELLYTAYLKLFEVAVESGDQIRERFKKALKDVIFIAHVEKNDDYKKEAKNALENAKTALETEITYLQTNFIGKKIDDSESTAATPSNKDFTSILTHADDNLLVKHIVSRLTILNVFYQHTTSLLEQLDESQKGTKPGVAINTRIYNYLGKLDPKTTSERDLKEAITDSELSELGQIGLDTIYAVREVHDAHGEVVGRAQGQIAGGLLVFASGVIFPLSMPVMGPIASTLITEGICDIVVELISQGRSEFSEKAYLKGKCISYGIAVATMGISAILKSTKILDKAIKACKSLENMLRKCPVFTSVCEALAGQVNKLGKYLENYKALIELSRLTKAEQLMHLERLKSVGDLEKFKSLLGAEKFAKLQRLKELGKLDVALSRFQLLSQELVKIGKGTLQSVVGSVISEKIVSKGIEELLLNLKPVIKAKVESTVRNSLTVKQLQLVDAGLVNEIISGSSGEMAADILKEVALGLLRHSANWKAKITSIAIDTVISTTEIVQYTENFCSKVKDLLAQKKSNNSVESEASVALVTEQVTEKVYGLIIHLASKYAHTFAVNPIMTKVWNMSYGQHEGKDLSSDEMETVKSFVEIVNDLETLGVTPGASIDDIKKAGRDMYWKTHPDSPRYDPTISTKFQDVNEALDRLIGLYDNKPSISSIPSNPLLLPKPNQPVINNVVQDIGLEEAHVGNILTLSKTTKQYIIVRSKETGEIIQSFGGKNKSPMVLNYSPVSEGKRGHFSIPEEIIREFNIQVPVLVPSYENDCLYDALVPQFQAQGKNVSAQDLRQIAQQLSLDNIYYGSLVNIVQIFNNPITRDIYNVVSSALLVGGFTRLLGDYYPSHNNSIVVDDKLKKPIAALRNKLNRLKEKMEEFERRTNSNNRIHMDHNFSKPCFGSVDGKENMMMGALEVDFNDGSKLKLLTVSGDKPFYSKARVENPRDITPSMEPEECEWVIDGFTFVDPGKPNGKKIFDVYNCEETSKEYNKSCAAQKLMWVLAQHLEKNKHKNLRIIGKIRMIEAFYKPMSKAPFHGRQVVVIDSCPECRKVLPAATGEESN